MRQRSGFSFIEVIIMVALIGIIASTAVPTLGDALHQARANRTASIVASDLEQAFSLAGRYRKPMRVACDCTHTAYSVAQRDAPANIYLSRNLSDIGSVAVSFSPATIDILPSGASNAPLVVTITSGTSQVIVDASVVGWVRVR